LSANKKTDKEGNKDSSFKAKLTAYKKQEKFDGVEPLVYAHEIMSEPVLSIGGDSPLHNAWGIFQKEGIRHLPVLNERQQILGILSDRDVLRHLLVGKENRIVLDSDKTAAQGIRRQVVCAHANSEIRHLALAMVESHVGCIPILEDEGRLIGLVTRGDILKGFIEHPRLNLWG
jgi:acetoin utilization protein AcuB